jgi:ATP-binding cassette, subfamily C (CFTR/MRP), member 1
VSQGIVLIIIVLQIATLVLWTKVTDIKYAVAAEALDLVGVIALSVLVIMEHMRSIQPSTITAVYLLSTIVGDSVQLRTLLLRGYSPKLSQLLSTMLAFKVILLVAEAWPKKKYLRPVPIDYSPEETTSILTRSVFWWLNSLFWHGSRDLLSSEDLFPLDQQLHSAGLRSLAISSWEKSR